MKEDMKKQQKYISKRQVDKQKDMTDHGHDKDHWCGDCFNFKEVDLRSEGLGKGYIITNVKPPPDNPNGSNSTRITI